jgi:hypothetical protein
MEKIVKESLSSLPTWEEIMVSAPAEIIDLIEQSKTIPQSLSWHPENEVYKHIRIVFDRARETGDIDQALAALFHDLGKVGTTKPNGKGGFSAHGHEAISARLVEKYKQWIGSLGASWFAVFNIVSEHMRVKNMHEMRPTKIAALKANQFFDKIDKFQYFDDMRTLTPEELKRYK